MKAVRHTRPRKSHASTTCLCVVCGAKIPLYEQCAVFERVGERMVERAYLCKTCFAQQVRAWPAPNSEPAKSLWRAWTHAKAAQNVEQAPEILARIAEFVDRALEFLPPDSVEASRLIEALEAAEAAVADVEWDVENLTREDLLTVLKNPALRQKMEHAPNLKLATKAKTVYANTLRETFKAIFGALAKALEPDA